MILFDEISRRSISTIIVETFVRFKKKLVPFSAINVFFFFDDLLEWRGQYLLISTWLIATKCQSSFFFAPVFLFACHTLSHGLLGDIPSSIKCAECTVGYRFFFQERYFSNFWHQVIYREIFWCCSTLSNYFTNYDLRLLGIGTIWFYSGNIVPLTCWDPKYTKPHQFNLINKKIMRQNGDLTS